MPATLLLLRHADTGPELRGRFIGSTDVPASETGILQLKRLQPLLQRYVPTSWYCSPSTRARQTEKALQEMSLVTCTTRIDEGLREIDFGAWERRTFEDIADEYPDSVEVWNAQPAEFQFPQGEGFADFVLRVKQCLERITADSADQVLVISHGGVIRIMICLLLGLDPTHYLLFQVQPGRIATLDLFGRRGVLSGLNL